MTFLTHPPLAPSGNLVATLLSPHFLLICWLPNCRGPGLVFYCGKRLRAGFSFFQILWDRKSGELFQKFNEISRMHTTGIKKPMFPDIFAKKAINFVRKKSPHDV
jgi:hypothetical protein